MPLFLEDEGGQLVSALQGWLDTLDRQMGATGDSLLPPLLISGLTKPQRPSSSTSGPSAPTIPSSSSATSAPGGSSSGISPGLSAKPSRVVSSSSKSSSSTACMYNTTFGGGIISNRRTCGRDRLSWPLYLQQRTMLTKQPMRQALWGSWK
ncbi:hypothetical protein COCSUDRAFT_61967 [Coccomyxa subellipsoidea C-169]|uniref:Uncharacterized protein n=1 Tax=Coccomyxa subellipsoidea (strain C-169) TaxID=574566 RepID=I0Z1L8_COCSC|nr:hypothetical protein COCSUDRAFT_61967 [Coccomyxa subellipsoidea C-169]EIE24537.1 hypothetical protein COCSUDRAFT_61967 [Coccomyxa subellipsoidea C-169]|eukprot:XP_005649081.1 hypothetical protein COCSUDRAFT_61967 [Coccomyxa subellipsoidea C-169]